MKVTTKGQVTIPQQIRDHLSVYPGADVEFATEGNCINHPEATYPNLEKLMIKRMRGRAAVRMTTDEILALTRGTS